MPSIENWALSNSEFQTLSIAEPSAGSAAQPRASAGMLQVQHRWWTRRGSPKSPHCLENCEAARADALQERLTAAGHKLQSSQSLNFCILDEVAVLSPRSMAGWLCPLPQAVDRAVTAQHTAECWLRSQHRLDNAGCQRTPRLSSSEGLTCRAQGSALPDLSVRSPLQSPAA